MYRYLYNSLFSIFLEGRKVRIVTEDLKQNIDKVIIAFSFNIKVWIVI